MKILKLVTSLLLLLSFSCTVSAGSYEDAVSKWKSYKDVATWLNSNFTFEKRRQKQISKRLKKQGPSGLLIRNPATLYEDNDKGYCADSANFAIKSLNKIDPSYNARWVFILNERTKGVRSLLLHSDPDCLDGVSEQVVHNLTDADLHEFVHRMDWPLDGKLQVT